jgi:uncharacterized zinc-type alcohol dehydrogenase-like protein
VSSLRAGSRLAIRRMRAFAARHGIARVAQHFRMGEVNDVMEHPRTGEARYRIILDCH